MPDGLFEVHVIADSTGDTAARVARAAAAQFAGRDVRIVRHPRMTTAASVDAVFHRIGARRDEGAAPVAVFSTMVDEELRSRVVGCCAEQGLPHYDLLGPALAVLEEASGARAERVPARPVGVGADYFLRIAAMEYAIAHDDGQHLSGLGDADIILVGVSRTGKTPLSMYLGYLGYRTANVPLVAGIEAPVQLFQADRFRVVALTIDPGRLAGIRSRRVRTIGTAGNGGDYAEKAAIFAELQAAEDVARRLGCPIIDTTNLALEEAAGRIIELVESRRPATHRPPRRTPERFTP